MTTRERPILFNAPMVRAILDGRKVQTRRPLKPQPEPFGTRGGSWSPPNKKALGAFCSTSPLDAHSMTAFVGRNCPYGQPGDRLWVRETFVPRYFDDGKPGYRADWDGKCADIVPEPKWTPSIHMPRWASRITLEITDVRVRRVQDISEADAIAEGTQEPSLVPITGARLSERGVFAALWNNTYGPDAWNRNDWVWAVSFKRVAP